MGPRRGFLHPEEWKRVEDAVNLAIFTAGGNPKSRAKAMPDVRKAIYRAVGDLLRGAYDDGRREVIDRVTRLVSEDPDD